MPRKCPNCGARELYVMYSEPKHNGLKQIGVTGKVIRRRLQCENCWEKFTTYEIDAKDLTNIRDTLHTIRKKARLSKTVMGRLKTAIGHCQEDLDRINGENSQ